MDWFEMMNRRLAEAPALATLWDTDRRMFTSAMAFARWQAAQAEVTRVMNDATRQAQALFEARLKAQNEAASADPKAPPTSMEDGFDLWLAALNEAMLGTMREEPYLAAQRQLVETGLEFRESLAALADEACEWFQLPSRSDFDDLARSVTELKREVRALARNRAADPDERPAPQERSAPKPKKKPAASRARAGTRRT